MKYVIFCPNYGYLRSCACNAKLHDADLFTLRKAQTIVAENSRQDIWEIHEVSVTITVTRVINKD